MKTLGSFLELEEKPGEWNLARKCWARMIEEIDETMGQLLTELKKQGIAENTLVIFTSDNGYSAWGYGLGRVDGPAFRNANQYDDDRFLQNKRLPDDGGKFRNTNVGWHVPFVARWPGRVPAGSTCERLISFYDMMPTFAEFAGLDLP